MLKTKTMISRVLLLLFLAYVLVQLSQIHIFVRTNTPEQALQYMYNAKKQEVTVYSQTDESTAFAVIRKKNVNEETIVLIKKDHNGWIPSDSFSSFVPAFLQWVNSHIVNLRKTKNEGFIAISSFDLSNQKAIVKDNLNTQFVEKSFTHNGRIKYYWFAHIKNVPKGYTLSVNGYE